MSLETDDLVLKVADAVGGLMEFWGFKRNMGRMWTLLYLEPRPLPAAELAQRLSLSSGAVSMTLGELQNWGVVKKAWIKGERRDYYEPETSIWKMVSRVFRERELRLIRTAIEVFEEAIGGLGAHNSSSAEDDARFEFARQRIEGLLALARIGEKLLDSILSGESIDASPLKLFKI
jgi:DNA-binding transcriptional regulator GbsR (MarR family)